MSLTAERGAGLSHVLAAVFLGISVFFVYRSFYGMRIEVQETATGAGRPVAVKV
ncbi:MAG: hypothetical protein H0T44_13480 [Gemmatimonadales bacterium]|nr:hypothetical protein [Gemmatimonadales bacterium]